MLLHIGNSILSTDILKTSLIVIVDNWGPESTALCMVPVVKKVIMKVGPVIDLF